MTPFRPQLLIHLKHYRQSDFQADLAAGITVAVVALPLAMAFGAASGATPTAGLVTAIIAGLLISALGGSRVQIGGPAGAFIALLYGIVDRYGLANLLLATIMAGGLLLTMGLFKLGQLIRHIPVPIVTGFTNGIAVIIALQQLKDFLGLTIEKMPAHFFGQISALAEHATSLNPAALGLGSVSLLFIALWPKSYRAQAAPWYRLLARVPGTLIVLGLGVLAVHVFALPVATIGSRFGEMPRSLPGLTLPPWEWDSIRQLVGPALSIALLGAIESLLCARIADGVTGDRHDPNQELMAQGIANMVAPLFGGIAATGTIARTMTNIRAGARSPVAGVIHALMLCMIVLLFAPIASQVPLASLAAILLYVAWNMGEWRAFRHLQRFSVPYQAIMLATFLLTVIFDLTVAVEVGLLLTCLFFIWRISSLTRVEPIKLPADVATLADGTQTEAWRVFGALFFGSVDKIEALLDAQRPLPDILVLEMHQVISLDSTGLEALIGLHARLTKQGGTLVLAELTEQPLRTMIRHGFIDRLGSHNVFKHLDDAWHALRERHRIDL